MMKPQQYIKQLLEFPTYQLREEDLAVIAKSGMSEYLTRKILSNKFRKSAPSEEVLKNIQDFRLATSKYGDYRVLQHLV